MGEHVCNSDIGEAKNGILESTKVKSVDGEQELFFKFFANVDGEGVFREERVECADAFLDLGGGGTSRMVRICAGVGGECEGSC